MAGRDPEETVPSPRAPGLAQGAFLHGLPALPGISSFPETNLRTYVRGPDGRDGLWFLSLEVASAPTAAGARLAYGVPYEVAQMDVEELDGGAIRYRSARKARAIAPGLAPPGHE